MSGHTRDRRLRAARSTCARGVSSVPARSNVVRIEPARPSITSGGSFTPAACIRGGRAPISTTRRRDLPPSVERRSPALSTDVRSTAPRDRLARFERRLRGATTNRPDQLQLRASRQRQALAARFDCRGLQRRGCRRAQTRPRASLEIRQVEIDGGRAMRQRTEFGSAAVGRTSEQDRRGGDSTSAGRHGLPAPRHAAVSRPAR